MSELKLISRQVASLLPVAGTDEFVPKLVAALREWVSADEVCMLVYPLYGTPEIHYREQPYSSPGLDTFVTGPFLLDPYYVAAARQQRFGFFSLKQLAPFGFRETEYYRGYYRFNGLSDECGFLVPVTGDAFVNLSLARNQNGQKFGKRELGYLEAMSCAITAWLQHHFQMLQQGRKTSSQDVSLRAKLESTLDSFGETVLTPREREIIQAVLHGHTSKSLAADLGISIETVKLHRKNAYRKLAVRNQTELFQHFIECLMKQSQDDSVLSD